MSKNISIISLCVSVFLMMLGVGMIVALLPQRIMTLTGSVSSVGYLASVFAIPYVLLQIPYGHWADKMGCKLFLTLGYIFCSLTGILYYYAGSAHLVLLGRFFQGAGEAPVWALAPALLSLQYPKSKGKVMGLYNAAIHLGLTLGPILGILVSSIWDENEPFLFYAMVCFGGGMIVHIFVESPHSKNTKRTQHVSYNHILTLVTNQNTVVILFGILLYGAGYGTFLTVIPAFLITVKGIGQALTGIFFALVYIALGLSQLITGTLSDKIGRNAFMIYGLLMTAVSLALLPGCTHVWLFFVLFLASLGFGGFSLSAMASLNESVSDSFKGTISGTYYLFWGAGYFLGPLSMGKFSEIAGFSASFYVFSCLIFAEVLFIMASVKRQRMSSVATM